VIDCAYAVWLERQCLWAFGKKNSSTSNTSAPVRCRCRFGGSPVIALDDQRRKTKIRVGPARFASRSSPAQTKRLTNLRSIRGIEMRYAFHRSLTHPFQRFRAARAPELLNIIAILRPKVIGLHECHGCAQSSES